MANNMDKSRKARLLKNSLATLAIFSSSSAMYACPLCYKAVASSGDRFIQALRSGILVLLPIPFFLFSMIAYMAYSKRDRYIDSPE
jgi:hypothetical protein